MPTNNLKNVETHFAFGRNWASYSDLIDENRIAEAQSALLTLLPAAAFKGKTFLDIGCGSGLHALAAIRLGAARVQGIDIDSDSVATTRKVLSANAANANWSAEVRSAFDLDPAQSGQFDIVYSWGVLHHTGDMWEAIRKTAAMVAPGGFLTLALYRRTYLDGFWKVEKRFYTGAPKAVTALIETAYVAAFRIAMFLTGGNFRTYLENYRSRRGMDYYHDVKDWLGGHPYESILAPELDAFLGRLGFSAERVNARGKSVGIFGSGCDEYVHRKTR